MNGEVVPVYEWRAVDGAEHAFNRFINRPDARELVSLCGRRFSAHEVTGARMQVVAGRCLACIHLAEAGSI